eukprot:PITA_32526
MGEYVLNSPMLSIPMGGVDVALGVQWLQSLGTIAFNVQKLFMKFYVEGKKVELRGIAGKPRKIISSNSMTKLLKNEQQGVIAKLCSLYVSTSKSSISPNLQKVLDNHSKVFETPKGLPPIHDNDHAIHLIPGSVPPNIRPCRYPYVEKSEIERMVEEMLEAGIIQPSQSSFSTPVVLVHKKDGSWRMCLDYRELNKLIIKDKVLQLLEEKQLYAKRSKCFFGVQEVEYLGHIVSHEGVKVDPSKIKAIKEWEIPTSIKNLQGFLRLTGYYRKFAKNYGKIAAPLTTLLKKDAFSWTPEATKAFENLKEAMCQAPVLATPNFTKTFIVECDASGNGIGVVLMQDERPIAFESRPIKGKYLHKTIYEKEMLAILHALKKWGPYRMGRHFKVKMDHDSLQYFLEQLLSLEE